MQHCWNECSFKLRLTEGSRGNTELCMGTMLPHALLLDLDDTILRFSAGRANLWQQVLTEHAHLLAGAEPEQVARVVEEQATPLYWGKPERAAWGRMNMFEARRQVLALALKHLGLNVSLEVVAQIADAFTWEKERGVEPLEDALDVIHKLLKRGVRLGLITNGSGDFQRRKLRRYSLEPLFEVIFVEGEFGVGKPHPSIFRAALDKMGIQPEQVLMVGDNFEADILGASTVGIDGVWVHHGRPLPSHTHQPKEVIGHIRELLHW